MPGRKAFLILIWKTWFLASQPLLNENNDQIPAPYCCNPLYLHFIFLICPPYTGTTHLYLQ